MSERLGREFSSQTISSKVGNDMHMSLRKRPLARKLGLVAALSVLGCLSYSGASFAATPTGGGINCTASDGKIDGRGSTLQNNLQQTVWSLGFTNDVCGPVANTGTGSNAGSGMVAYNYASAVSGSFTGSGAGLLGAECRTDAFWGTDTPYTSANYTTLQAGGETATGTSPNCNSLTGHLVPPFTPIGTNFPAATDNTTSSSSGGPSVMSFPVAGASVVVVINLTTATGATSTPITGCPTSGLQFTGEQISELFGGDVTNWEQLSSAAPSNSAYGTSTGTYGLASESPADDGLATCNEPVTRVVRNDSSGTTNIFKNYLIHADNLRTEAQSCLGSAPGALGTQALQTWTTYNFYPTATSTTNAAWPGYPTESGGQFVHNTADGTCSPLTSAASTSGGPALFTTLLGTAGGVGYLDLADYENASENPNSVAIEAPALQSGDGTSYQSAVSGKAANCSFTDLSLPGGGNAGAVGLNSGDTWANDNATVHSGKADHNNGTDFGSKYPICGLTWQLTYTQQDGAAGTGPVSTLTNDQRQTLYSYITYELSSTAQAYLAHNYYAPLPSSWLPLLQGGFQSNF